eukprot:gene30658-37046_t
MTKLYGDSAQPTGAASITQSCSTIHVLYEYDKYGRPGSGISLHTLPAASIKKSSSPHNNENRNLRQLPPTMLRQAARIVVRSVARRAVSSGTLPSALRNSATCLRTVATFPTIMGHQALLHSARAMSTFKEDYQKLVSDRAKQGVVPKPLDAQKVGQLVALLKSPPAGEEAFLLDLLANRVPPGVDEAAYVKAAFLSAVAKGEATSPIVSPEKATELLGTMQGGYNILTLVELLDHATLGGRAAAALSNTILMFDAFHDVETKAKAGNKHAQQVLRSWAEAEWFLSRPEVPKKLTYTVFKVPGETNTDDLSPAPDAWSRPDIPLHALAMLKNARDGVKPDVEGSIGPISTFDELKKKGFPLAYVGDVVGTGSSRKSATNSILWFFGDDIPNVPNKKAGGVCIGGKIAPIFFNTMQDSGALPLEMPVDKLSTGDVIDIFPYEGVARNHKTGE